MEKKKRIPQIVGKCISASEKFSDGSIVHWLNWNQRDLGLSPECICYITLGKLLNLLKPEIPRWIL